MAVVTFDSLVNNIAPQVPGCPMLVVSSTIRKVIIDLCERAKVWRVALAPVVLTSGVYNYTLTSSVAGTEVSAIISNTLYRATAKVTSKLSMVTGEFIFETAPSWPDLINLNQPSMLFKMDESSFNVAPVPDTQDTYTVNMFAAIRPSMTSTTWDSNLAAQYQREVYHGVLHELMMIPDRVWSDDQKSLYHGKQWTYLLNSARARASKGFGRADIVIQQRPWA